MSILNLPADLLAMVTNLAKQEVDDPITVLNGIFSDTNIAELKGFMNDLLEVALTTDNAAFNDPSQRSSALMEHETCMRLIEAAYIINVANNAPREKTASPQTSYHITAAGSPDFLAFYGNILFRLDSIVKMMAQLVATASKQGSGAVISEPVVTS